MPSFFCPAPQTFYPSCFQPLLTPYELEVALGSTAWKDNYPMDYYSSSGGPWSNIHHRLSASNTADTK